MAAGTALLTWEEMKAEQDRRRLKREAAALTEGETEYASLEKVVLLRLESEFAIQMLRISSTSNSCLQGQKVMCLAKLKAYSISHVACILVQHKKQLVRDIVSSETHRASCF